MCTSAHLYQERRHLFLLSQDQDAGDGTSALGFAFQSSFGWDNLQWSVYIDNTSSLSSFSNYLSGRSSFPDQQREDDASKDFCQQGSLTLEIVKDSYCKMTLDDKRKLLECSTVTGRMAEDLLSTLR